MAATKNARNKEIKIEDLLRLKRAERPDADFWNSFDRELHQRMLQTLVKKDPWYLQLLRAASRRIAQTGAIGAAAAFLAIMLLRPAFVDSTQSAAGDTFAQQGLDLSSASSASTQPGRSFEIAMSDMDTDLTKDYGMEAISGLVASTDWSFTPEYGYDRIEAASYDISVYIADTASFVGSGLATGLVY